MKVNRHGKATTLSQEQFLQLLELAPTPMHRLLWATQRYCASRIGETLSLTWAALEGDCVTFTKASTKGKRTRQLVQTAALQTEVAEYKQAWIARHGAAPLPDEFVFHTSDSTTQPITRQAADKALKKATAQLGVAGCSTHSFRRTAATLAVRAGHRIEVVQRLLGHKSLASTGEYLEVSSEEVMAAALAQ